MTYPMARVPAPAATLSGLRERRPSGAGTILQSLQPLGEEPLAPLADDLSREVEFRADRLVVQALRRQQYDLRPHDLTIWCRILASDPLQFPLLGGRQNDPVRAPSWHFSDLVQVKDGITSGPYESTRYVIVFIRRPAPLRVPTGNRYGACVGGVQRRRANAKRSVRRSVAYVCDASALFTFRTAANHLAPFHGKLDGETR